MSGTPRPRAASGGDGDRADRTSGAPMGTARAVLGVAVASLLLIGLVMTFSASFVTSSDAFDDPYAIFVRHGVSVVVGVLALLAGRSVDRRLWRRTARLGFAVAVTLSLLVLVPGVGTTVAGSSRWLALGPIQFQPSEMLKLAMPLALADVLATRWGRLRSGDLQALVVPAAPMIVVTAALVFVSPDLESTLLVAVIGLAVLWVAGMPMRLLAVAGAALGATGAIGISMARYRVGRLEAWLDPFSDASNYGYQAVQGYLALGSGGLWGSGLGAGRAKWLYLPNPHTDFIFAIIGEELGLLGTMTVLALYGAIAWAGVRICRGVSDPFDRLASVGIVTWILAQAAINMGSVVGLLPVTGVTLPLVSYGGTSLVVTMLGLGALLSFASSVDEAPVTRLRAPGGHGARDGRERGPGRGGDARQRGGRP